MPNTVKSTIVTDKTYCEKVGMYVLSHLFSMI